jgi:hypothetical protein
MFNLSQFNDEYTNAAAPERSAPVPDGKYQVKVEAFELTKAKTGNPMLKFELRVLAGDFTGRAIFKNAVITANTLQYVKSDLLTLGFAGKLSELEDPAVRAKLLDLTVQVTLKTKGQDDQGRPNTNVYFDRRLELSGIATTGPGDRPPF